MPNNEYSSKQQAEAALEQPATPGEVFLSESPQTIGLHMAPAIFTCLLYLSEQWLSFAIKSCLPDLLRSSLHSPLCKTHDDPRGHGNGSLLPCPIQSTPHSADRGFFSLLSHSVTPLSLRSLGRFQQGLWTSSKGKCLLNCCPCLGSQLASWILTPESSKMSRVCPTLSAPGWDGEQSIGSDRKLWQKTALK